MKLYLVSLCAGLLVGAIYGLLGVRSPAPPVVALVGLLGILAGEQATALAKRIAEERRVSLGALREDCARHMFAALPRARGDAAPAAALPRARADEGRA